MHPQTSSRDLAAWPDTDEIPHAREILLGTEPIPGTLAERYLRETIGVRYLPQHNLLRFHSSLDCSFLGEESPALVHAWQDEAGLITAVHVVYLCSETLDAWLDDKGERVSKTVGSKRRGCMRLAPAGEIVGRSVGLEAGLLAMQQYSMPVWAVDRYTKPRNVWFPEGVQVQPLAVVPPEPMED